ncbi:MAG: M48 family metalloprotease, partial [Candidatus Rokubacteria bacterium]|nr:M48 family metalloprotease [Candidatus Rokubacteria bacterium]
MTAFGRSRRCVAWSLVVALLASACATRNVPPIGAGGQPFRPEADERQLWAQAEKEEEALLKRTKTYDDPLLEEYLTKLADRLLPENVRAAGGPGLKVGVIRDPTLNAFAMPNGRVYVHTGLLSQMENEAQLATVLGHELTHFTGRHALKFTRDARNKQILYTVLGIAASIGIAAAAGSRAEHGDHVGAAVLSQTANAVLGLGLQLAAIASINGYGRDLEREADTEGLARLVAAGYDPREAPKVFTLLKGESGDRGSIETFFFGSHPRLEERIESTSQLVKTTYASAAQAPGAIKNTEEFELRMRPVVRENALLDVRSGRFKLAQRQLDRVLAITPRDPIAHLYYGDL